MKCFFSACERAGELVPVLRVYPPLEFKDADPAKIVLMDVRLCGDDAARATTDQFLTAHAWADIVMRFHVAGRVPPDRSRTLLDFVRPGDPEMSLLGRHSH